MDGRGKTRKTGDGIEEIIYSSFNLVMKLKKSTNISRKELDHVYHSAIASALCCTANNLSLYR